MKSRNSFFKTLSPAAVATLTLALSFQMTGCKKEEAETYRIPKEDREVAVPSAPAQNMQPLPGMQEAVDMIDDEFTYQVPEGWTENPPSGMRKADFSITDDNGNTQITVLVFPGDVGGLLANINRWRGQVGLDPVAQAELDNVAEPMVISAHQGHFVKLEGASDSILGGILGFHGFTWFFKMQGPTTTVMAQEETMKTFLNSFKIKDTHH